MDEENRQQQKAIVDLFLQRQIEEERIGRYLAYQIHNDNLVSLQSLCQQVQPIGSSIPLDIDSSSSAPTAGTTTSSSNSEVTASTARYPTPTVVNVSDAFRSHEIHLETSSSMRNVANIHRALEMRLLQAQQERIIVAGVEQQQQRQQQAQAFLLSQQLLQLNSLQQQYAAAPVPIYLDQQYRPTAPQFTITHTNYGDIVAPNLSTHFGSGSDFNQQNLLALNGNLGMAMFNANILSTLIVNPNISTVPNNFASLLHGTGHRPLFPQQFVMGHLQERGGDITCSEPLPSVETNEATSTLSEHDGKDNKNDEEVGTIAGEERSDKEEDTNHIEILRQIEKNVVDVERESRKLSSREVLRHGGRKRKVKEAPVSPSAAEIPQNETNKVKSLKDKRNLRKESRLAFRYIPSPYTGPSTQPFYVSSQEILERIPPEASCIFYLYDRRINMDAHPPNSSFYSLLRSWVQDDPCRVIPEKTNLMDVIAPSTGNLSRKNRSTRDVLVRHNYVSHLLGPSKKKVCMLKFLNSNVTDKGTKQGNPEIVDLLTEHVQKAKKNRKRKCSERAAQFKVVLPKLRAMGINI